MQFQRVAAALALAGLLAVPAYANQPQQAGFFVSADYGHASATGVSGNTWGLGMGGEVPLFHSGFHFQLDGAYSNVSGDNSPAIKTWNVDAAPYYAWSFGRAGISVHYIGQQGGEGYIDDTLYDFGAYGEWWAGSHFTLGVKSGTITNGTGSGSFVGGRLAAYLFPDLALSGIVEYEKTGSENSETDTTLEGEYLISESLPISVFGGYTLASPSGIGSTDVNLFFVGVKIYANGHNESTLVERQRSGTLGWLASFGTINF
jgi:hypothetical protein